MKAGLARSATAALEIALMVAAAEVITFGLIWPTWTTADALAMLWIAANLPAYLGLSVLAVIARRRWGWPRLRPELQFLLWTVVVVSVGWPITYLYLRA
jgi:hypothetical protein